jgi:hypothetical protein
MITSNIKNLELNNLLVDLSIELEDNQNKQYVNDIKSKILSKLEDNGKDIMQYKCYLSNIQNELDRLKQRKSFFEREISDMNSDIEITLNMLDIKKAKYSNFDISIKKNPTSINILDKSLIPTDYINIKTEVIFDKIAIKKDMEQGVIVDGVELIQKSRIVIS